MLVVVVVCVWGFCCVIEVWSEKRSGTRLVRREVRMKCRKWVVISVGWLAQVYVRGSGWYKKT